VPTCPAMRSARQGGGNRRGASAIVPRLAHWRNGHLFAIKVGDSIRGVFNQLRQMESKFTADLQAPGAAFIEAVCADLVATVIGITAAALIIRP
jgi:hypothetical protein